jgi:RNA 2',3'-cyclic 3'-phosphodiesterase
MSGGATNLRTFIAIDLPAPILDALAATQEQIQAYLRAQNLASKLRWSPPKNLHLTLRFLGDTTPAQREEVSARLQALAAATIPFSLTVDLSGAGVGGFPNLRQPRVLWIGLGGELATLMQLQRQTEEIARSVGFAPEEKAFAPHLTMARAARDADRHTLQQVGQALAEYVQVAAPSAPTTLSFGIDQLLYYQSVLKPQGSIYTPLATLPFTGG